MDDNQRKRILQNVETLVTVTDFDKLSQACLQYDLLTPVMLNNIYHAELQKPLADQWNEETIKRDRHKRLFEKITKRGPEAFQKLHLIFRNLNYKDALKTLNGNDERMISISLSKEAGKPTLYRDDDDEINTGSFENNNLDYNDGFNRQLSSSQSVDDSAISLHQYEGLIRPKKTIAVQKAKSICKHEQIETYPMESKTNRGIFFLVNIIDFPSDERRLGADIDAHSLLELFKQLGFKLYAYTNLTGKSFFELLDELLALDEIKYTECFVMALMTHGHLSDGVQRITFADGSIEKVEEIEKRFYHRHCPNLIGKPKIFIYPYCRGEISDRGVLVENRIQTDGVCYDSRVNNMAQLSDVIKCYATTEGFKAHRDADDGSWYIQCFVDILAQRACDTSFEDMLKLIQEKVQRMRTPDLRLQTASYVNTGFNKILYFNPGV